MAANYVQWTAAEVRERMEEMGFKEVKKFGTFEMVFERTTKNPAVFIRVYSSINCGGEQTARAVGKDAGRVVLIEKTTDKPVWKGKRVHRTQGFLDNVRERCRDAFRAVAGLQTCPVCKGYMVERKRRGDRKPTFLGCLKYPACRGTRNIRDNEREERARRKKIAQLEKRGGGSA